jgi:hypothetical protein
MRYLLLIYTQEPAEAAPEDIMAAEMKAYNGYGDWLTEKGYFKAGEALQPTPTATTVRVREGKTVTTDGPYAETKEQLGGFYLVDCPTIDEAIEAAARIPGALHGSIEVRPIWDFAALSATEAVAATA